MVYLKLLIMLNNQTYKVCLSNVKSYALILIFTISCIHEEKSIKMKSQDFMKPDSTKQLTEEQIGNLIEELSLKIEGLSAKFKELSGFVEKRSVFGGELDYENNVKYKENPEYVELKKKKPQDLAPYEKRKLAYIGKEVPYFPEDDSLKIYVQFISREDVDRSSRSILPLMWICNWAVELSIQTKDEKKSDRIYTAISDILENLKKRHES
jgi:hypothetical protein